jgi:hypothetical protein
MVDRIRCSRGVRSVATLAALSLTLSSVVFSRSASAACAIPATAHDESASGDLPDQPLALDPGLGESRVKGSISAGDQFDSASFTIEPGEQLDAVILAQYVGAGSIAVRFFTGTDVGADPPAFLGETGLGAAQIGADSLELVGIGPLGPGLYSISIVDNPVGAAQQYALALHIGTVYDETVDGDLPSFPTPPLALQFGCGSNHVLGSVTADVDDFDDFSFTIEPDTELGSVILAEYAGTGSNAVRFFTGTDTGADPPAFLGETDMSAARIGADYLELIGIGPLGPDVYSMSIVNTLSPAQQYHFVLSVPEPGPVGAALGVAFGLGAASRVRRARRGASAASAPAAVPPSVSAPGCGANAPRR